MLNSISLHRSARIFHWTMAKWFVLKFSIVDTWCWQETIVDASTVFRFSFVAKTKLENCKRCYKLFLIEQMIKTRQFRDKHVWIWSIIIFSIKMNRFIAIFSWTNHSYYWNCINAANTKKLITESSLSTCTSCQFIWICICMIFCSILI